MKKTALVMVLALVVIAGFSACANTGADYSPPPASGESTHSSGELPITPASAESPVALNTPEQVVRPEPYLPESPDDEIILAPTEENHLVLTAQTLLGVPFADGGSSPEEGFDNSGFIYYVLSQNGYVNSPRGLYDQSVMGNTIDCITDIKSGDLVFFSENGERAQFGGIYIGYGIMISCRMPGETVKEIDITSSYYRNSFFTAVRVI